MQPTSIELLGTILFALAILHTFLVKEFLDLSHRFPKGSILEGVFHLLGEIEVVFGIWAALLLIWMTLSTGFQSVVEFQNQLHFTEAIFVFCIMVMAATRPVMSAAQDLIQNISQAFRKIVPIPKEQADLFVLFVVGPLAGSFITEPAAMTVTALLLSQMIKRVDHKMIYLLLATLFVNVSIGGALTPYAAPPILMVANKWNWGLAEVFGHYGVKSIIAVLINATLLVALFWKKWNSHLHSFDELPRKAKIPLGVTLLHFVFLAMLVVCAHYQNLALGVFMFFLGVTTVTKQYQDSLRLRESLLVAFFLGGIIVFGPLQAWWLSPLLKSMSSFTLFLGATALTAVTDNAALTYLGAQVEGLSLDSKYYLVAGAITGGGLTIIANAPNAAGYTILQSRFPGGINPLSLFLAALLPTAVAFACMAWGW